MGASLISKPSIRAKRWPEKILFQEREREIRTTSIRTSIEHKFETKNIKLLKFKPLQKRSSLYQNTFQGDFCSDRRVKIISKNWEKFTNDPTIVQSFLPDKKKHWGQTKQKSGKTDDPGGKINADEGYHKEGNLLQGPVSQPYFPSIKEERRAVTST